MQETDVLLNPELEVLNVTLLEPRMKHPTIFQKFDELQPGKAFMILNDHDPKPLYYQLIAERGNVFTWQYEEKGPVTWRVIIKKNDADDAPTLGELAASDVRKAEVFKKYNIDFCCGGKKTLKQACEEKNLDVAQVEKELQQVGQSERGQSSFDFNRWQLDFLIDYIYNEHHKYWYEEEPVITELVEKVAGHHGQNFPWLLQLRDAYESLRTDLNAHFMKEERVLFPYIKQLVQAKNANSAIDDTGLGGIVSPIQMMEADHEGAGELLLQIRKLTNDYTLPAGACNSFGLMYHKLNALEQDLHQHIHLENNILFPKAIKLEKELLNK